MKSLFTIALIIVAATSLPVKSIATELTNAEKEGLRLMREEEKLAHDVYVFLYEKWGLRMFDNISNAETRHFEAIGYLMENYGVKDSAKKGSGKFNNKELRDLYNSLTKKGSESLIAALEVGALIEEIDIADLQKLLAANPDSLITGVYQNLLRGSGNHIRAFTGQLENRDAKYTPTVLNENVYAEILAGTHQRGNPANCILPENNCPNQNNKQGRRKGKGQGYRCGQKCWN